MAFPCGLASSQHDVSIGRLFIDLRHSSTCTCSSKQGESYIPFYDQALATLIALLLPYSIGKNTHKPSLIAEEGKKILPLDVGVAKSHRRACGILKLHPSQRL